MDKRSLFEFINIDMIFDFTGCVMCNVQVYCDMSFLSGMSTTLCLLMRSRGGKKLGLKVEPLPYC